MNSAFKFYKKEIIQNIELRSDGWLVDAEIVYHLQKMKSSYIEMPVKLIDRKVGKSTLPFLTPLHMLRELLVFKKSIKKS